MKDTSSVTGSAVSSGVRILQMLYELGFPRESITVPVREMDVRIDRELEDLFPNQKESWLLR
ncbi:hypothetical protein GF359_08795, partial [candidate division WOR-3 bacterium]|nr:hypothetical protein [candidate division WOR-3 bacterium]MBD3365297.1 hypothetical protein [candidate division WOR-3 bacterium]